MWLLQHHFGPEFLHPSIYFVHNEHKLTKNQVEHGFQSLPVNTQMFRVISEILHMTAGEPVIPIEQK